MDRIERIVMQELKKAKTKFQGKDIQGVITVNDEISHRTLPNKGFLGELGEMLKAIKSHFPIEYNNILKKAKDDEILNKVGPLMMKYLSKKKKDKEIEEGKKLNVNIKVGGIDYDL